MPRFSATFLASLTLALAFATDGWAQAVFTEVPASSNKRSGAESDESSSAAIDEIKSDAATRSVSIVRIDADLLRGSVNKSVELNVRSDLNLNATVRSVAPLSEDRFVWQGKIEGGGDLPAGDATIVVNQGDATGTIRTPEGRLFRLQPVGGGDNALIEIEVDKRPPDHPPGSPESPPETRGDIEIAPTENPKADLPAADSPVIDLVVAYTKNASRASGDIKSLIDLAVAESNQTFVNSGVSASVRVVHTVEFDYADASQPAEVCQANGDPCAFDRIIRDFAKPGDGKMDEIHGLRDQYGGDVAVLIVNNDEACGQARVIGSDAAGAYAIVQWKNCATGYYSFIHEIGHLAGARHNIPNDPSVKPFAHGHGFRHSAANNGWRTIMGYRCNNNTCNERIPYWSSPDNTYAGIALGTAANEDNTRVWRERAAVLAGFKSADGVPTADEPALEHPPATPAAADR